MNETILVLNAGSSSIKFSIFAVSPAATLECLYDGSVTRIGTNEATFRVRGSGDSKMAAQQNESAVIATDHTHALQIILDWLEQETAGKHFIGIGHRVVHGGTLFYQPVRVDESVLAQLKTLIPLAPLHQPHALLAIETLLKQRPQLPQVACFDTAFHTTMPWQEQQFALPQTYLQQGVRRYGFHGLSYEYIASVLPEHLGETAHGKVVVAHLGHGVSMCALMNRQSVATTMSFTPLDGLPMGTRSGAIDPSVVLYLLEQGMTANDIADLLNHQSGLLGLSGISADMRTLLSSDDTKAAKAVDYFCYRINREVGALAAALGGLDALVFTGGIGEHVPAVRNKICRAATWLGLDINEKANETNSVRISNDRSRVTVWVIPTFEDKVIARHTAAIFSRI